MPTVDQETKTQPSSTPSELIARARAMVPALRERAARCEAERRVSEQTIEELREAGLFKIAQPRRYGGYEMGWEVFSEVVAEIASGCGSTGWVYAVLGMHPLIVTRVGVALMDEVWGRSPQALVATAQLVQGQLTRVEGGYRGSAVGAFSSGCHHADWIIVSGLPVEGSTDRLLVVLPRKDVAILDTWRAIGLTGTGSHHIKFEDVFIPQHRARLGGAPPFSPVITGPMYRVAGPAAPFGFTSVILGIASGALSVFVDLVRRRSVGSAAQPARLQSIFIRLGESVAEVDSARILTRAHLANFALEIAKNSATMATGDAPVTNYSEAQRSLAESYAAKLCYAAVERIFNAAGASQLTLDSLLQRGFRDILAATRQISLNWDVSASNFGRLLATGASSTTAPPAQHKYPSTVR